LLQHLEGSGGGAEPAAELADFTRFIVSFEKKMEILVERVYIVHRYVKFEIPEGGMYRFMAPRILRIRLKDPFSPWMCAPDAGRFPERRSGERGAAAGLFFSFPRTAGRRLPADRRR
jgi:hypothetical protein